LFVTSAAVIVTTRLLAEGLGPTEFGVYAVVKRVIGILVPFTTLTMGVALARCTAMATEEGHRRELLMAATIIAACPSVVVGIVAVIYSDPLGRLLFGQPGYSVVVASAGLPVIGIAFYTVLYGHFRGTDRMGRANLMELIVVGLGPGVIAACYAIPGHLHTIFGLIGGLYCAAAIPIARRLRRHLHPSTWSPRLGASLRELLRYGCPRVPGGITFAGILGAAPIVAAYTRAVEDAGYLVAGQIVFGITDAASAAFGLVLLPKVAQLVAEDKVETVRAIVDDLLAVGLYLGTFAAIHLLIWGDYVVRIWLGEDYDQSIPLLRILSFALIPYVLFCLLRSIVDAVDHRAINARHLYLALAVTVAGCLSLFRFGNQGLAAATVLGMTALGVATVRHLRSRRWLSFRELHLPALLALNLGAGGLALIVRHAVQPLGPSAVIVLAFVLELLLFALYCAALRWLNVRWMVHFGTRVVNAK
jgi:O-antigen/teichoic acid export membrane protein